MMRLPSLLRGLVTLIGSLGLALKKTVLYKPLTELRLALTQMWLIAYKL